MNTTIVDAEGQPIAIVPSDPAERIAVAAEKIAASLVDVCGLLALQVKVASKSLKLTEETLEHMRAAERRMAEECPPLTPDQIQRIANRTPVSVERALHNLDQAIENARSVRDTREERRASEAEEESTETLAAEATRRG